MCNLILDLCVIKCTRPDSHGTTQTIVVADRGRASTARIAGTSGAESAIAGATSTVCGDGLDNEAVARKLRCSRGMVGKWRARFFKGASGGIVRRAAAGCAAQDQRRAGGARGDSDFGEHAARADPLVNAGTG